jgi:GDP-4-dehydro-6-deoxy-D-mannose reductase
MRVLITGATGFVGRHLASLCAAQGCEAVIGLGRRPRSEADVPGDLTGYEAVDLSAPAQTEDAVRAAAPDRVFHLAADASVAQSWNEPARVFANNTNSTMNLIEAVRPRDGCRLLIAGSGEEYGEPVRLPVVEDHPLRPQNPYAVSKAAIDIAAGFCADSYDMPLVRTRAFNHAGPGQSDTYVVSSFARQIAEGEASNGGGGVLEVVTGNTEIRRDFTDVRDVVRAYWMALDAEPDVYNVCSGRSVAIADILAGLADHARLEVRTRPDPKRFRRRDAMEIQGSHQKLTSATGWEPEIPLEQTLRDMLEWWRGRIKAEVAS